MKTIISLFLTVCSVFAFTCSAQNASKSDITFNDSILKAAEQGFSLAQELLEDNVATKAFATTTIVSKDTTTITESFRVTKKFKKGTRKVTKRIVGQDMTIIKDTISFI